MITIFMSYNVEESHSLEVVSVNMLKYPSILHSYKNKHNELLLCIPHYFAKDELL